MSKDTKDKNSSNDDAAGNPDDSLLQLNEYEVINKVLVKEMKGALKFRGKLRQCRMEMGELIVAADAKARAQKVKGGAKLYNKWLVEHAGLEKAELKECRAIGKLCYVTFKEKLALVDSDYLDTVKYNTLKLALGKYAVLKQIQGRKSKKSAPYLDRLEFSAGGILVVLPNGDTYDLAELTFAMLTELLKPVIDSQTTEAVKEDRPGTKGALLKEIDQLRLQRDFARTIIKSRLPEEYDAILANQDALDPDVPSELHLSTSAVDMGDKEEDPADTAAAPLVVVADGTNASEILLDEVTGGAASQVHGPNGQDIDDVLPADLDPDMAQENAETVDEGDPVMPWNKPIAKRATSLVEAEARRGVGSSVSTIAAR
jgi:hypothetical protein